MKIDQVAAQLYTIRAHAKPPADTAKALKKVADIGYKAVQISGLAAMPEEELVKMLADNGLTCCATHEHGPDIMATPEKIVDRLAKLGCKYTAYPYPAGVDLYSKEGVLDVARSLDKAGAVLRAAGQVLTYHNHDNEFYKIEGKTVLDWIYDESSPENLQGEIDTYWVQAGGGNPASWCRKLKNRLPLLHLKDFAMTKENKHVFAEIGYGNLEFPEIIREAEASGCEWFIIEQDICPGDPFESLAKSFAYTVENLVS